MLYRAIGLMSGSSLDGLDIAFVQYEESRGKWDYSVLAAECLPFTPEWQTRLSEAVQLNALDYLQLHTDFGLYIGHQVNEFINRHQCQHQVQLIASHGHTTFHVPERQLTAQLGDGAAIAAITGINVVSDLRAMDVALGGQGAPIVPLGERLLLRDYPLLLNIGGIANLSAKIKPADDSAEETLIAFDICPANRVLNMFAAELGLGFDEGGKIAASGHVRDEVLAQLNRLDYYAAPYPKSLANSFGTDIIFPILKNANLSVPDALRTMVEHIAIQTTRSVGRLLLKMNPTESTGLLVTGGGAFNHFLIERLNSGLQHLGITVVVPDEGLVNYKEAIIMGLLGILRWREENTVLHTVTGASRSSIGGAVWMGQEA